MKLCFTEKSSRELCPKLWAFLALLLLISFNSCEKTKLDIAPCRDDDLPRRLNQAKFFIQTAFWSFIASWAMKFLRIKGNSVVKEAMRKAKRRRADEITNISLLALCSLKSNSIYWRLHLNRDARLAALGLVSPSINTLGSHRLITKPTKRM